MGKLNILTTIFSIIWYTIRLVDLEINQKHRRGYKKKTKRDRKKELRRRGKKMERKKEKRREQERGRELRGKGNTWINQSIPMLASILNLQ